MDALTITNPAREEARMNREKNWEKIPEYLHLYGFDKDERLTVPRGFASQLVEICDIYDHDIEWDDQRVRPRGFVIGRKIPAFDYQRKIIDTILDYEQGIAKSPTGSGKTVAGLEIIRRSPGKSLVIVNTKEIAAQWIERTADWLGPKFPVGMVGDGTFEIGKRLTIALQGTLWSRRDQLTEDGFFDLFSLVCLDECHHATARTYNDIFGRFSAAIRFGMSATPEKTGEFELAKAVIGPIVVEVTEEDVGDKITKPTVHVIETSFGAVAKSKRVKTKSWFSRASYNQLIAKLVKDRERNELIAHEIVTNHLHNTNLVISRRLEHLELLWDALIDAGYPEEQMVPMVGAHKMQERKDAVARVDSGSPLIFFTTLADEALDAPRLDRIHLVFPTSNPELVRQQIGRIRRRHAEKADSIVLDYRDFQVKKFEKQYMTRRHELYDPQGFEVIKRKAGSKI